MNIGKFNQLAQKHVNNLMTMLGPDNLDSPLADVLNIDIIAEEDIPFVVFMRYWSDVNIISDDWIDEDLLACKERLNDIFSQITNERIEAFVREFSGIDWVMSLFQAMEDYKDEFVDKGDYIARMLSIFDYFRAYACCLAVAENRSIEVDGEEDYNICVNKLKQLRESDTYGFIRPYITAVLITMREDQTLLTDRLSYLSSVI